MPKQVAISPEVHEILVAATVAGSADRPVVILPAQVSRELYVATDKVLKALGGKWNKAAKGHVFDRPVEGELAEALRSGKAVDAKRTAEQFFTPEHVAMAMAVKAGIEDGTHVLEPSAGAGALVAAAISYGGTVTAIEKDPLLIDRLVASGSGRQGHLRVVNSDFTTWEPPEADEVIGDVCFDHFFDVVMMNPPFSKGQDIAHVLRALAFLWPGGRLVAVMSPHWTFAESKAAQAFRGSINEHSYTWEDLPAATFRGAGTEVGTGILTITKGEI